MILYQHHNSSVPYNYDVEDYENFTYIPHLHRDPELVCVLEGEIVATVEDRSESVGAGDFVMILPNQVHTFETPVHSKARVIVFAEEYVREFHKMLGNRIGKTNRFSIPEPDRTLLLKKLTPTPPHRMDICAGLALACGAFLKEKEKEGWLKGKENKEDLIHKILSFISSHYTENISLTAMAEALGYEPHYLSRCFHRLFDKNFKQFINEYRLHHARQLLADPTNTLSVIDIAYASGFQSVRNFNRVYRESEGTEPRRTEKTNTRTENSL